MKVSDAIPGQILYVRGKVPKSYTKNLDPKELQLALEAGFIPAFLMPAWLKKTPQRLHDRHSITPLLYIGKVKTSVPIGGLKTHHVFLYEGQNFALQGYDFRNLEAAKSCKLAAKDIKY